MLLFERNCRINTYNSIFEIRYPLSPHHYLEIIKTMREHSYGYAMSLPVTAITMILLWLYACSQFGECWREGSNLHWKNGNCTVLPVPHPLERYLFSFASQFPVPRARQILYESSPCLPPVSMLHKCSKESRFFSALLGGCISHTPTCSLFRPYVSCVVLCA